MQLPSRKQQWEERRNASIFCLKAILLAATLVTAVIVFLSLLSHIPDDVTATSLRSLVDTGAESLVLLAVLVTGLASLGHVVLTARWSLEEMWRLFLVQLLSVGRRPPSHIERPSPEIVRLLLAVRSRAVQLARFSAAQQPCLRPLTKAPFGLFQQAPLRVSP
jgi:hypothetical protein